MGTHLMRPMGHTAHVSQLPLIAFLLFFANSTAIATPNIRRMYKED